MRLLCERLPHQVRGETIDLEDVLELLKFSCLGGGVTDVIGSASHAP